MQSACCTRWKWEQDKVEDEQGEGVASGRTQVIRLMNAPKSKMRKIEKAQRKEKRRGVRERERESQSRMMKMKMNLNMKRNDSNRRKIWINNTGKNKKAMAEKEKS